MHVGVVALKLFEEFISSGKGLVGLVHAWHAKDNELFEALIGDEVEVGQELVEEGCLVVVDEVCPWLAGKC